LAGHDGREEPIDLRFLQSFQWVMMKEWRRGGLSACPQKGSISKGLPTARTSLVYQICVPLSRLAIDGDVRNLELF
jgi:hypothetical protein